MAFFGERGSGQKTFDQGPHKICKQEDSIESHSVVDHMLLPAPLISVFSNLNPSHLMQA